jgi:hypothetical protein
MKPFPITPFEIMIPSYLEVTGRDEATDYDIYLDDYFVPERDDNDE